MIYIFEDRDSRKRLHQETVNHYSDVICFAKFDIDDSQNLSDFIIERFCDADCIIFHKSYTFKGHDVNLPVVQEYMLKNGIRFCIYSGGIERGSIGSDGVVRVNANVMYENLSLFVERFKGTNEIVSEILLWGEKYRLNQLMSLQCELFNQFFITNDFEDIIPNDDLENIEDTIQSLFDEYGFDAPEVFDNFANDYKHSLSWKDLLNIIDSVINKIECML